MKLTKRVASTVPIIFLVMAITLVAMALPVSAATLSANLLNARYDQQNQTLKAHVRNNGCTTVWVYVHFVIMDEFGLTVFEVSTNIQSLPSSGQNMVTWLEVFWPPPPPGRYYGTAYLYYGPSNAGPWTPDGLDSFAFTV